MQDVFAREWRGLRIWIDPSSAADKRLYSSEGYEPQTLAALKRIVGPEATVLDVGADRGMGSLYLRQLVGEAGAVHVFDASQLGVGHLRRNVELNGFTNVHSTVAVVGPTDQASVVTRSSESGAGDANIPYGPIKRMISLDTYCEGIEAIDLIRISADGYAPGVVAGAMRTLVEHKPTLVFEISPSNVQEAGDDWKLMRDDLGALNYSFNDDCLEAVDLEEFIGAMHEGSTANLVAF